MEKSQSSKLSKLVKGLKGTLNRQKTIGKDRVATPSGQAATLPPERDRCTRDKLPLPLPPMVDAICQLPYYHPHLNSKDDLTNFMSQYSLQEGYFLLRKSFKDPTSYTITVNHRFGLKHIRVVISNGRFSLKDRSFDTIDEMVQYYSYREIPNEENIRGILLHFPIRRPPIEFGEYIVVSKQDIMITASASPYLVAIGKQRPSEGDSRPQPPNPRPPAPLPRGAGNTNSPATPRKDSLVDQTIPPPVGSPLQETVAPPALSKGSSLDAPVSSTPIGTSSANDQNPSTNDTVSPNPIGQPLTTDPNLTAPIGPSDASENERCDCGLLMREAFLPLGWSVHVSQDTDTKDQPFFLSPNNETNWDLPLPVALLLSPDQQDLIRNLGFDSDIKAAGLQIRSSMGCSTKTRGWSGAAATQTKKTWVPCDDYESSKSLREALERPVKPSPGVQSKTSGSSQHTPNGDLQHPKPLPKPDRQGRRTRQMENVDDCATILAIVDNKTSTVA